MSELKLYSYFRSSAAYRVRLALAMKDLEYKYEAVHLVKDGGKQNSSEYRQVNPMGHVPALIVDENVITESMAIIQYLDLKFPQPILFPMDPLQRAHVLQICETINSGIQPLQNLKVLRYLEKELGQTKPTVDTWTKHWITKGLSSLEELLVRFSGSYCVGGDLSAADCFLLPQCFSSRRFGVEIDSFANISRIEKNLLKITELDKAHPKNQPDFEA